MIEGFSGHADKNGLLDWVKHFTKKPKNVFIIHGEEDAMNEFSGILKNELGIATVIPARGEAFMVTAKGVFETEKKVASEERKEAKYDYKRLEIVYMLDKLKDELEEASSMVRNDLKTDKNDIELEELKAKLQKFENYIVEILK
jgi:metallo-beta-lactamase family protein